MAKKKPSSSKPKSLSHGRPLPITDTTKQQRKAHLSSQTTRTVIRKHHNLLKAHTRAVAAGDISTSERLEKEIAENGGLEHYQAASILGQSESRGGDTSKHLLGYLSTVRTAIKQGVRVQGEPTNVQGSLGTSGKRRLRMLDVGALSTNTAAGRSGLFDITRIDLNSQEKGILQQDFMQRPLPKKQNEVFDIVCLSLVVNYVPDAKERGDMLRRVEHFLQPPSEYASSISKQDDGGRGLVGSDESLDTIFPALWLVLPAPCVTNSRYMNIDRLREIMWSLGYVQLQSKLTAKLAYFLFRWNGSSEEVAFPKVEVNPGGSRNNFLIVT